MCELKDHMDPKAGFKRGTPGFFENWGSTERIGTRLGLMRDYMGDIMPGSDSEEADDEGVSALKNVTTGAGGSENKSAKFKTADRKGVTKKSLVVKKPTAKGYS